MPKSWLERVELLLIYVLAGFVFWPNAISSICLILLLGLRLLQQRIRAFPPLKESWLLLPLLAILGAWIGFGFATDGMREIQLWATWLAAFIYFKSSPFHRQFTRGFVILSFFQAIAVLAYFTLAEPLSTHAFSQSFRDAIERVFHVHPTFLSAAWMWAAFLTLSQPKFSWRFKVLFIPTLLLLSFLAGGKMPLIAGALIFVLFGISKIKSWKHKVLLIAAAIAIFGINVAYNPLVSERFSELKSPNIQFTEGQLLTSTELRLGIWNCSWQSVQQHWLLGVGTGNTRSVLEDCYRNYGQVEFFDTEFNTHNQYMHFWLSGGILSLLGFLVFLIVIAYRAWQEKNIQLLYFCLFFALICLTENYLSRQFGMMLASFFVFGLSYQNDQSK